jgi:hypothetical protein
MRAHGRQRRAVTSAIALHGTHARRPLVVAGGCFGIAGIARPRVGLSQDHGRTRLADPFD